MSFMDNLAANPSGTNVNGSNIYGQPPPQKDLDVLGIVNSLKDREMRDFKDKSNFMADLSLKQEKMRALFDPNRLGAQDNMQPGQTGQPGNTQGMNTVMARDPNQMTGYEKGELGIRQQGVDVEKARLAQQGKLGQEGMDIKSQQEKLNQEKSDQINKIKQADLQRKIDESDAKIQQANERLQQAADNAEAQLKAHKELAAAVEERHKAELAQKDAQFQKTYDLHQQQIKDMEKRLDQQGGSQTTTEVNPDGTKKIVTTKRGAGARTVQAIGKDGNVYNIPEDKMNDLDADGTPHWKRPGGEE